jgi:hypothetical protein
MYAFTADQMLEFYNIYLDESGKTIYSFVAELQRRYNISQNVSALIWQSFDASEVYLFQRIRANQQPNPIPTDIHLRGYKSAKFNQHVTDSAESEDNTKWSAYRISLDMNKPFVVSLGRGREITIKLNSNRTNIGE